MTVTTRVLIPAKTAADVQTTQYTVGNATTIIDKFTAVNYSTAAAVISVNLVTAADTPQSYNLVTKTKTLQAGETYTFPEIVGQVLGAGDTISTLAGSTLTIGIRASGREIT